MGLRHFLRALRFAWPYRYQLALSFMCALLAAALWSLNFTAIFPILKIFGSNENLQVWIDRSIKKCQDEQVDPAKKRLDELHVEHEKISAMPAGVSKDRRVRQHAGDMAKAEAAMAAAQLDLHRLHVAKRYIDAYCPADKFQTLCAVLGAVGIAVLLRGVFEFWQEWLVGVVIYRTQYDLRNFFFRRAIHLDVGYFSEAGSHDLMTRFTGDIDTLGVGMRTAFGKVVAEPLKALACIVVALWINWELTLICLILIPFALFILTRFGRTMKRATKRMLEQMSSIFKVLQEVFQGIRIIKAFAREPHERRRFRTATREYYKKAVWVVTLDALTSPAIETMTVVGIAIVFLLGAYIVIEKPESILGIPIRAHQMESEALLQLYALLAAAADPIRRLSNVYTRIQYGCAAADRVFAYMDTMPKIQNHANAPQLPRHQKDIEFRNVCFSYTPGQVLLEGIDLHVKQGEIIAFVGKNGCGKTSLLNLLPRFYDPDHGSILIDGVDIRGVNLRSLRKQIAIVTQDMFLFDDTVFKNIAYGHPHATRDQVEAAARKAQAHDFIVNDLTNGYDTVVGAEGKKLSGGQRQRICLARAFLADPSILILDEFTNQNDPEAEVFLHRAMHELRHGRTIFFITHRLNTLELADSIVVLDEGRVAAIGTHKELMKSCPLYLRLNEVQQQRMVA